MVRYDLTGEETYFLQLIKEKYIIDSKQAQSLLLLHPARFMGILSAQDLTKIIACVLYSIQWKHFHTANRALLKMICVIAFNFEKNKLP